MRGECVVGMVATAILFYGRARRRRHHPSGCLEVLFYGRASRLCAPVKEGAGEGGWRFSTWQAGDAEDELRSLCASADVLVSGPGLPPEVLDWAGRLKLLQVATAGFDWVPFDAVPRGCSVCNTSSMDVPIAEYVMLAILEWQLGMRLADATFRAKQNFVPPFGAPGHPTSAPFHAEAAGKTLGIVGLGRIGEQVACRASAFGMRVLATTSRPRTEPLPPGVAWRGTAHLRLAPDGYRPDGARRAANAPPPTR